MALYMLSARDKLSGAKPGDLKYLRSDDGGATYAAVKSGDAWAKAIMAEMPSDKTDPLGRRKAGNVLIFVHGFNENFEAARAANEAYRKALTAAGWDGVLIGFDWPSNGVTFEYLLDRANARLTANELVTGGIALLERLQQDDCSITVHVLAHSMGAFVVREAFTWSYQDVPPGWVVGQLMLVAPDIGADGMAPDQAPAQAFDLHAGRITVYWNRYDKALTVSDAKRLDTTPRLGRVGLPDSAPPKMCGVDCAALFETADPGVVSQLDPVKTHCFYFDQPVFWQDVVLTLLGGIDRSAIPTRIAPNPAPLPNRFVLNTGALDKADYEVAVKRAT